MVTAGAPRIPVNLLAEKCCLLFFFLLRVGCFPFPCCDLPDIYNPLYRKLLLICTTIPTWLLGGPSHRHAERVQ
ncbi:hypothetical protein ACFLWD_02730 [Chloroflexota bacterium]